MRRLLALAITVLVTIGVQQPSRAQDQATVLAYAAAEAGVRAQYEALLAQIAQAPPNASPEWLAKTKSLVAMLSYNQAAIFAFCSGEAEQDRSQAVRRVPASENLVLRTCVEIKMKELNKFSERIGYVDMFFADRIASCGEQSRLRDKEGILKPYDFLFLDEPKIYDFAKYNECLLKP